MAGMDETPAQRWAMVAQCALSCVFGCLAWLAVDSPNSKERLLAALIAGFGGVWLLMFCWAWLRYGWKAARGMSMDG
jgi:hypothetical protein